MLFGAGTPYFPRSNVGAVISFGLPGEDEVSRMATKAD